MEKGPEALDEDPFAHRTEGNGQEGDGHLNAGEVKIEMLMDIKGLGRPGLIRKQCLQLG